MDTPGIQLTCPEEAPAGGSIPIVAVMCADPRTYWDNNGLIYKALSVTLVRRDEPGLFFLDKIDPHVIMLPDEPLQGRPSDDQLDAETWMVSETKLLDASDVLSTKHGSGEYFVTAAFSKWWAGLRAFRVSDPHGKASASEQPQHGPVMQAWPVRPFMPNAEPSVRLERTREGSFLVFPFGSNMAIHNALDHSANLNAWISVLGFKLDTRGGACAGVFDLGPTEKLPKVPSEVSIPISALDSRPDAGCWIFLGFVANEALPPNEIWLNNDDVR